MSAREQVSRLLALAPYLQSRGGARLSEVAQDFGVAPQQVLGDLRVLWMCGLPGLAPGDYIEIDFEALESDPDGLVRIENAEYLSRPIRLSSSEAAALIVALRALRDSADAASREVLDRTLAKLEEAATSGPWDDSWTSRAHVEVHRSAQAAELDTHRRTIQAALDRGRQLSLDYYVPTRDETTRRVVDPLALLRSEGNDYLDAWCHHAGGRRLFRLSRIHDATLLETRSAPPDLAPRDLARGLFEPAPDDPVARVRLSPALRWFVDYYPVESVVEVGDGGLEAELRFSEPLWLVRLALRLAPGLEVLAPTEVRELVTRTARSARALYDGAYDGAAPTDPEESS